MSSVAENCRVHVHVFPGPFHHNAFFAAQGITLLSVASGAACAYPRILGCGIGDQPASGLPADCGEVRLPSRYAGGGSGAVCGARNGCLSASAAVRRWSGSYSRQPVDMSRTCRGRVPDMVLLVLEAAE